MNWREREPSGGTHPSAALRRLLLVVSIAAAASVAAPSSSAASAECARLSNCETLTGPWVVVPFASDGQPPDAQWEMYCPPGPPYRNVLGTDWNLNLPFQINVFINQNSGFPIYNDSSSAIFFATNTSNEPGSFQPLIGCQINPLSFSARNATAGASAGAQAVNRVATKRLGPGRTRTYSHRCQRGEKLLKVETGIAFFKQKPPSAKELNGLLVERENHRNKIRVKVRTGRKAGDNEPVFLQIHALCRLRPQS
jgi:phage FluMu protein Com